MDISIRTYIRLAVIKLASRTWASLRCAWREHIFPWLDKLFLFGVKKEEHKNSILLVRLDAVGDFVLWTPVVETICEHYIGNNLILLANSAWSSLANSLACFDEVWPVEIKKFSRPGFYRWRLLRRIRRAGFSEAVQPVYSRVFATGDASIRASAARKRLGWDGDLANQSIAQKKRADSWYTHLYSSEKGVTRHELERNSAFVEALGGKGITTLGADTFSATKGLRERFQLPMPYFAVSAGASWGGKMWPAENFSKIIDWIAREKGWNCVLCGSESESGIAKNVAKNSKTPVIDLTGRTDLMELTDVIRGAALLIGNDSAPIHLAAAVKTISICVLGGGHFGRFLPYPEKFFVDAPISVFERMKCYCCDWQCNQVHVPGGPVPCISNIEIGAVKKTIEAYF